ncbi:SDR family NAD(P)-dependent oxidoreductase [Alteriqipengyuania flavescens]|uniref:SDR family NAD(P)-dependent oxidoreductase n=1 Tax=Alteriqipengyuania flavescens TaxID=3053610 RepID=UPI0025B4412B|nr:SDR family NAD(P)-dependent oxidoreductase [Alteriqipengyuania flavescens]WJY19878.1 SDR family NAD(P)-dependent oxidoreductase [Alteriqipengyuania flavescens]WJY25820.1 SDR family NAD(P)-dependent oxidoreductase [Alteriqipengyuania flavescens]
MSKNEIDRLSGFAIVTGASSGIGLELAKLAAKDGCSLLLVADRDLAAATDAVRECGAKNVETLEADLATRDGIDSVMARIGDRPVDVLLANAGHGQGGAFLDQDWNDIAHVIDTNIKGAVSLIHKVGQRMRARNAGRILVTGSIAGHLPGAFQLVYNSTKAFIDDFCVGLHNELMETDVVVTCLLPGVTDTQFFKRAGMEDTKAGQSDSKADPAKVAKDGYDALLEGDTQVVSGFMNKVQTMFADILPDDLVAQMHRRLAKPKHRETEDA